MSTVAYEQVLDAVRTLSPEELQKLVQQINAERQPAAASTNGATALKHSREREMRWLSEHRSEHIGQWVALEGNRLICHDADLGKVFDEAQRLGFASPFTAFMEDPERPFMGGW